MSQTNAWERTKWQLSVLPKASCTRAKPLTAAILSEACRRVVIDVEIIAAGVAAFAASVFPLANIGDALPFWHLLPSQVKLAGQLKSYLVAIL